MESCPRLGNTFNYLVTTRIGDPNQLEILQQVDSIRSAVQMSTFHEGRIIVVPKKIEASQNPTKILMIYILS